MQNTSYIEVKTCGKEDLDKNNYFNRFFLKQFFICTGVWTMYFIGGLVFGSPTVIIPQIRKDESFGPLNIDAVSWLSSISSYLAIPFSIILNVGSERYGRKLPLFFVAIITLIAFIILVTSKTLIQMFISYVINGVILANNITLGVIFIPEYTSPNHRAWLLPVKTTSCIWGIWVANAIGTYCHWTWIGHLGIICCMYFLFNIFFWPESPTWLASKGKFKKCSKAHKWLKGTDDASDFELQHLIKHQKDILSNSNDQESLSFMCQLKVFFKIISTKEFYKPILLAMTGMSLYVFCGKYVNAIYALDIIRKISKDEAAAYNGMLILDGITVLSMYFGCYLAKILNRRTLLLLFSCTSIVLLYTMSLYLYLIKISVIIENKYVSLILLSAFSIAVSCGPLIIVSAIFSELTPLRLRSFSLCLYGVYFQTILATLLKTSPYMFLSFDMFGTFLFFAVSVSVLTLILYLYLPETKGKTAQEIAELMRK